MGTRPTAEFRSEALRLALTSGLSRKQVASDLGVGFSTLSRWIVTAQRTGQTRNGLATTARGPHSSHRPW